MPRDKTLPDLTAGLGLVSVHIFKILLPFDSSQTCQALSIPLSPPANSTEDFHADPNLWCSDPGDLSPSIAITLTSN